MERYQKYFNLIKKLWPLWVFLLICLVEERLAWSFYSTITPFPESEYLLRIYDAIVRDGILAIIVGLLYFKRKRLKDRTKRYFPVIVVGCIYLAFAFYICYKLNLDSYALTLLGVITGLNNNIILVLLAAMFYHRNPSSFMRGVYFCFYMFVVLLIISDAIYFWQTSMHVQKVFFRNFNIYAIQGILASLTTNHFVSFGVLLILLIGLFRVPKPTSKKPNFPWSLLCVAVFTMILNITYFTGKQISTIAYHDFGVWATEKIEESRKTYRDFLIVPIAIDIPAKAIFNKEKLLQANNALRKRSLTNQDVKLMRELGVMKSTPYKVLEAPAYDRIVLLVLESVHRDYINFYNEEVPKEATPFLNALLEQYPRVDNYYSSAIPTTEGLNAMFRSQFVYDADLDGDIQPSLYRALQEKGWNGIFLGATSQYYNNEFVEYPEQFGMKTYYAREYLEKKGYKGASGWGYHNDVMYQETLEILKKYRNEKLIFTVKTIDMHQPYPYYGTKWEDTPEEFRDNQTVTIHGMYWVDRTLKKFFEDAEKEGLFDDRTLFVITTDHNPHSGGEYLKLVKTEEDRRSIAPIPLIFVSKNTAPFRNLEYGMYASQIDLTPTLLCLSGIKPSNKFAGSNLLQYYYENDAAIGYFGNEGFYFTYNYSFIDQLDDPNPSDPYKDSLANYIFYKYYESSQPETPDEN